MTNPGDRFAFPILVLAVVAAIVQLGYNALTLDTWMDEGKYLMKGHWYLTGELTPYSSLDPTNYMPISFYPVGLMERLFGVGYLPGRALMIGFAALCLALVYVAGTLIGRSRLAGVAATALVAAHSVTLTYFATATPYAMVSCLSMTLIVILLTARSRRLAYAASGLILWALVFTRPDMLPIAMIPAGWALWIEPVRKLESLAITALICLAASIGTIWLFGLGLLQVVLDTPGIAQITMMMGVPAAPISNVLPLTVSPMDPVVQLTEIPMYFFRYFLRPYSVVAAISLTLMALRIRAALRESTERKIKPIDLILGYFWITVVLHFMLSLSYCVDCIIPYTNYFLPVGALGAAGLTGEIFRLTREPLRAVAAFTGIVALSVAVRLFPEFPTLLRPTPPGVRTIAGALATQIRPHLSAADRVLVLCDSVEASQAVWLAGGVIEPRSLYLPTGFREPKPGLSNEQRDRVDQVIWEAGMWSDGSMRRAVEQVYSTLLIERRDSYADPIRRTVHDGIPFGDLVLRHFQLAGSFTVANRRFELYRRRG